MKRLFLSAFLCFCTIAATIAADETWLTDLEAAKAKAKESKKHVLIDFTGSDWCPPCKQLTAKVFKSKEFAEFANEKLILVELDFPNAKKQTAELKATNKKLSEQYKIEGFPTIVVLSPEGKELGREVGYAGETPALYVEKIKGFMAKSVAAK